MIGTYTGPLWHVRVPGDTHVHLARTNIAECETECGIVMHPSWPAVRSSDRPPHCCSECETEVLGIGPIFRGLRA